MALISATLGPVSEIETFDWPSAKDRFAVTGFHLDGIDIFLATHAEPADKDAAIVASAGLLIDALARLRDAAAERMAAIPETELRALAGDR